MEESQWLQNIKALMERAGDNDYSLGRKTGIAASTLNRIMNAVHTQPKMDTMIRIAGAYNILVSQLIGEVPLDINADSNVEIFYAIDERKIVLHQMIEEIPDEHLENTINILKATRDMYIERRVREQRNYESATRFRGREKRHYIDRRINKDRVLTRVPTKLIDEPDD